MAVTAEIKMEKEALDLNLEDSEYWEWHKSGQRGRMSFAFFVWLASFLLFNNITIGILGIFGIGVFWSILIGVSLWFVVMGYTIRYFMISVPEVTGLVTINLFKDGTMRSYPSGLHFAYPWEQAKEGNFITLRLITKSHDESYPSQDGPIMIAKWSYQYRPNLRLLPKYIAVDESTIDKGITDVGSSILSQQIAVKDAIDCKKKQGDIQGKLKELFETKERTESEGRTKTRESSGVEQLYGIDIIKVALADLDYDEEFQKVRSSEQISARLKDMAGKLKEGKQITDKDALNAALIINKNATKHIQEVEGEGGQALAALLMSMATGGKPPEKSEERKGGKK